MADAAGRLGKGVVSELFAGVGYVLGSLSWLTSKRGLLGLALMPAIINVVVIGAFFAVALFFTVDVTSLVWGPPAGGMMYALWVVVAIGVGLALLFFGYLVGLMVGSRLGEPFLDTLSRRVEEIARETEVPAEPTSVGAILGDTLKAIVGVIPTLIKLALVAIPLLLLNFIPVIGSIVSAAVGATITGYVAVVESMTFAAERHGMDAKGRRRLIKSHKALCAGFGAALTALLFIPFANMVVLPVTVIAGTRLFLDLQQR